MDENKFSELINVLEGIHAGIDAIGEKVYIKKGTSTDYYETKSGILERIPDYE